MLKDFDRFFTSSHQTTSSHINHRIVAENNWRANFEALLNFENVDANIAKQRIQQLSTYKELSRVKDLANVLIQIKEINELKGDFSALETIATFVS